MERARGKMDAHSTPLHSTSLNCTPPSTSTSSSSSQSLWVEPLGSQEEQRGQGQIWQMGGTLISAASLPLLMLLILIARFMAWSKSQLSTPRSPAAQWEFSFWAAVEGQAVLVTVQWTYSTLALSKCPRGCMHKQSTRLYTQHTSHSSIKMVPIETEVATIHHVHNSMEGCSGGFNPITADLRSGHSNTVGLLP